MHKSAKAVARRMRKRQGRARAQADEIYSLPGVTFQPNFDQYSGYLRASPGNYLHYWLVSSQSSPYTDPIVLWLSGGGPGCSTLGGLLAENGPFRVNPDGQTLFENVFAWNKVANLLYLESPQGVCFSFHDRMKNDDYAWNDDKIGLDLENANVGYDCRGLQAQMVRGPVGEVPQGPAGPREPVGAGEPETGMVSVAADVALAVLSFFNAYPQYQGRAFFVAGQSYGAIQVALLTRLLVRQIVLGVSGIFAGISVNLKGMLVGNSLLSEDWNSATFVDNLYFHGVIGKTQWDKYRKCCETPGDTYCNVTRYLLRPDWSECSMLVNDLLVHPPIPFDIHNMYQQCYEQPARAEFKPSAKDLRPLLNTTGRPQYLPPTLNQLPEYSFASNDANGGYVCYMKDAIDAYVTSNHLVGPNHQMQNIGGPVKDMSSIFEDIVQSRYVRGSDEPFRILVYNGDADLAHSFVQAEFFIENLASLMGARARPGPP
ncbi:Protein K10C2.1 [Aphelenchoides avenae]|nr:Protein K10C2.1 [Aphelenchus avenae]